jgi:photosystem II stability/assembly factor-like uncharacterized protein
MLGAASSREEPVKQSFRQPPPGLATGLAILAILAAGFATGRQDPEPAATAAPDPATLVAELQPKATHSLILDLANAADRAIAVGERGHILVSESRSDWRQVADVPTRSTLTGVAAFGSRAWAVGHDGVILGSTDGGLTWQRQRAAPFDPDSDDPHNGSPLLDVLFLDENNGFAIGAYALMLRTRDGGATWETVALSAAAAGDELAVEEDVEAAVEDDSWTMSAEDVAIEEESDPHLNAIARTGDGSLFIVAERGAAFRSTDGGENWQRLSLPYDGSMFGVIGYEGRHVLAYGLRGNVLESRDLGDTWIEIQSNSDLSLMGGAGWDDGGAVLVGANGVVLTRTDGGANLLRHTHPDAAVLSSVLVLAPNGALVLAGENGVSTWTPN